MKKAYAQFIGEKEGKSLIPEFIKLGYKPLKITFFKYMDGEDQMVGFEDGTFGPFISYFRSNAELEAEGFEEIIF